MSDYQNGRPPGQNNLDAHVEPYVDPKNDPSATAQKPDEDRPEEDGVEVREGVDEETQRELDEASKNVVEPHSVEEEEEEEEDDTEE